MAGVRGWGSNVPHILKPRVGKKRSGDSLLSKDRKRDKSEENSYIRPMKDVLEYGDESLDWDTRACRDLGRAVLDRALRDLGRSKLLREKAILWLTDDSEELHSLTFWAEIAGLEGAMDKIKRAIVDGKTDELLFEMKKYRIRKKANVLRGD